MSGPGTEQLEAVDAPAALLPDGNVLVAASPIYAAPTEFFEFDGSNLTDVPAPPNAVNDPTFMQRLLLLPTGQVLFTDGTPDVEVYTSIGFFNPSWAPTITSSPSDVTPDGTNYTITGTQLNGLSQAVSYGDDYQAATNYPLVAIQNNRTLDFNFARTHSFSTMAVATGDTTVSTKFDVSNDTPLGPSTLYVIANGIESTGVSVNVTSTQLPPALQIKPTTLTFPNTVVGGTSAVETVELTNPQSSKNSVSNREYFPLNAHFVLCFGSNLRNFGARRFLYDLGRIPSELGHQGDRNADDYRQRAAQSAEGVAQRDGGAADAPNFADDTDVPEYSDRSH